MLAAVSNRNHRWRHRDGRHDPVNQGSLPWLRGRFHHSPTCCAVELDAWRRACPVRGRPTGPNPCLPSRNNPSVRSDCSFPCAESGRWRQTWVTCAVMQRSAAPSALLRRRRCPSPAFRPALPPNAPSPDEGVFGSDGSTCLRESGEGRSGRPVSRPAGLARRWRGRHGPGRRCHPRSPGDAGRRPDDGRQAPGPQTS